MSKVPTDVQQAYEKFCKDERALFDRGVDTLRRMEGRPDKAPLEEVADIWVTISDTILTIVMKRMHNAIITMAKQGAHLDDVLETLFANKQALSVMIQTVEQFQKQRDAK